MPAHILSARERAYTARRRRWTHLGSWLSGLALLAWLGALAWLAGRHAGLLDPRVLLDVRRTGADDATVQLLASLAPVLGWALFASIAALLIACFGNSVRERRLLALIDRQQAVSAEASTAEQRRSA